MFIRGALRARAGGEPVPRLLRGGPAAGRAFSAAAVLCALATIFAPGCTSRFIYVTSSPPGAEVTINNRVAGTTPVRVGYVHYGWYEIVLRKDRYRTAVRKYHLLAPFYAYDPLSLVSDSIPVRIVDELRVHVIMEPIEEEDPKPLAERAEQAAEGRVTFGTSGEFQVPEYRAREKRSVEGTKPEKTGDGVRAPAELPPDLREPEGIKEKPPEGPRLAPELSPEGKPDSEAPEKRRQGGVAKTPAAGDKGREKRPEKQEILETIEPRPAGTAQ